jgi:predicted extracellular nuclease
MKQTLLFIFAFFTLNAVAQNTCNELFISEYVEGWSNNKALEIYNPAETPLNLTGYTVKVFSNGASTASWETWSNRRKPGC